MDPQNSQLPVDLIAQLVLHCSCIAEIRFQSRSCLSFGPFTGYCLRIISIEIVSIGSSNTWILCIKYMNFMYSLHHLYWNFKQTCKAECSTVFKPSSISSWLPLPSKGMHIRDLLEKTDRKLFKVRSVDANCSRNSIIPRKKETNNHLRNRTAYHLHINPDRFKNICK